MMMPGLYIHIPFCRRKCDYCSFYSLPADGDSVIIERYISRLIEEFKEIKDEFGAITFDTVYLGGGTPSMLRSSQIDLVLESVSSFFHLARDTEITIEMNPDDFSEDKISGFINAGVNRVVLGLQSRIIKNREFIGRGGKNCTYQELETFFSIEGITRCIDFIAGIPGQTPVDIDCDFSVVRKYRPEHISLYMLSVEEGTPLASRLAPDNEFEDNQVQVWEYAINLLKSYGYTHYEISNFAIPGYESRHNMKYWNYIPYIGTGPGAHTFFNNRRYSNPASLAEYLKPGSFSRVFDERSNNEILVEFIMTSLRNLNGFRLDEYEKITGNELPQGIIDKISEKEHEGLLRSNGNLISFTEKGVFFADSIIYDIVESYL